MHASAALGTAITVNDALQVGACTGTTGDIAGAALQAGDPPPELTLDVAAPIAI
jgi:hypothetical protein